MWWKLVCVELLIRVYLEFWIVLYLKFFEVMIECIIGCYEVNIKIKSLLFWVIFELDIVIFIDVIVNLKIILICIICLIFFIDFKYMNYF